MSIELYRDLAQWLFDRHEEGQPREVVESMLFEQGYTQQQVDELVRLAYRNTHILKERLDSFDAYTEEQQIAQRRQPFSVCAPIDLGDSNAINDSDLQRIRVSFRSKRPYVVVMDNFLSDEECDALMALAANRLKRALVVDRKTGGDFLDDRRTSENLILEVYQDELCKRIEDRIARVIGVPVENGESLQIMRYGVGAEYQPHQDFFASDVSGEAVHFQNGGNRIATLVMYLNDVEAGGSTTFPHAGLEVFPHKGSAVYFAYTDDDGRNDALAFHGGSPVVAGEKWIASKWIRERATPWGLMALERGVRVSSNQEVDVAKSVGTIKAKRPNEPKAESPDKKAVKKSAAKKPATKKAATKKIATKKVAKQPGKSSAK